MARNGSQKKGGRPAPETNPAPEAARVETPAEPTPAPKQVERKATVTRIVEGRAYTYVNLGKGRIDNGDRVAQMLRGLDLDGVYAKAAEELQTTPEALKAVYGCNNPGRQRMTLGNLLRLNKGTPWRDPKAVAAERKAKHEAQQAEWRAKREAAIAKTNEAKAKREQAKAEKEAKAA